MNNEQYLISVIVPVYNVEKYLDECVESIVNQTYKNLEIILVDDGSTDNSGKICDKWSEKDSRIKVIHKENGGSSSARNVALDIAHGDYIGFVDSDDFIDEDMFDLLLKNALEYSAEISRCSYRFNIDGKFTDSEEINDEIQVHSSKKILDSMKYSGIINDIPVCKVYRKDFIADARFDETLISGEDVVFNYYLYKKISRLVSQDAAKYSYRIHNNYHTKNPQFHYRGYIAMKKIVCDPECPNSLFIKFFNFASWSLHDIVIDGFNYDFNEIRKDILKYKKPIEKVIKDLGDKNKLIRLKVLSVSPLLYKLMLKLFDKLL
ncbi:MAG: glycosyltransferase family 2 protein [Eubacterium sp.]